MHKVIYILVESEATSSDRAFWDMLKTLKTKTTNVNVEQIVVQNLLELFDLEEQLSNAGWTRVVAKEESLAYSSPFRPCVRWIKRLE